MKPTNADYEELYMEIESWLKLEDKNDLEKANEKLSNVAEFCVNFLTEMVELSHETECVVAAIYELIDGDVYYLGEEEDG